MSDGKRHVTLQTRDGHFVREVVIPFFEPAPDALFWGSRFFIRFEDVLYREAFCFWVAEVQQR